MIDISNIDNERRSVVWVSLEDKPFLKREALDLDERSFPDYLTNSRTSEAFRFVTEHFPETIILAYDGNDVLATCFSAPIALGDDDIPAGGWEDALGMVLSGGEYNAIFAFSISVAASARGLGLGGKIIEELKANARDLGYKRIITPVRPTGIKKYPDLTVDQYAHLVDDRTGESFDPWVRTLQHHGGQLAGVGIDSHVIKNDDGDWPGVAQWEEWTSMKFPHDGEYEIPGGCSKLKIHDGVGEYREDCIWIDINLA